MPCKNHTKCQTEALKQAEALCIEKGLRFTEGRREIFKLLWQGHKALTAAQIMERLGNNQPPVTYRALDFLTTHGFIHHVVSLNAYVGCSHLHEGEHVGQLLICEECHDVQEVEPDMAAISASAKAEKFKPKQTHIEMLGVCKKCL